MAWAWALLAWSLVAMGWWGLALWLVRRPAAPAPAAHGAVPSLTIFKPVPPVQGPEELALFRRGVEALAAQLDAHAEMLVGLPESDRALWDPIVRQWGQTYSPDCVRVIFRAQPDPCANPKIAWQRHLAEKARGALWLWSDADIVVPSDYLASVRAEWAANGAHVLTHGCVVRRVPDAASVLEALFLNVEMFPGVRLLGRLNRMPFAFGASMLFEAERFRRRVDFDELGQRLAEDFLVGRRLGPAALGSRFLETVAQSRRWPEALRHYLRWQKTVRWCRPGGFAAQVLIHPCLGWAGAVAWAPGLAWLWIGLGAAWALEIAIAVALCAAVGCRLRGAGVWAGVVMWPPLRGLVWLLCWLPWPVRWRDRYWWRPVKPLKEAAGASPEVPVPPDQSCENREGLCAPESALPTRFSQDGVGADQTLRERWGSTNEVTVSR
jgi:ceramide glucosyltransferase